MEVLVNYIQEIKMEKIFSFLVNNYINILNQF